MYDFCPELAQHLQLCVGRTYQPQEMIEMKQDKEEILGVVSCYLVTAKKQMHVIRVLLEMICNLEGERGFSYPLYANGKEY